MKKCMWCEGTSSTIDSLEFQLETKDKEIAELKAKLENKEATTNVYSIQVDQLEDSIRKLEDQVLLRAVRINKQECKHKVCVPTVKDGIMTRHCLECGETL